jgi:hypothetical protein
MKKLVLVSVTVGLLLSVFALAQYGTKQDDPTQASTTADKMSTKAVSLSGKISDDGKAFVSDTDNKNWTVSNPEAVKGHEGHEVTLRAHVDTAKNEIHVLSVKMGKDEMKGTTKKDEMQK